MPAVRLSSSRCAGDIVDGSVRRAGKNLRVVVQLIDAGSGVSFWADRYDREMKDIFAVQDEVTHKVAAALGVKMQTAELTRALAKSPSEFDAYPRPDPVERALEAALKAVQLDPQNAYALCWLAIVHYFRKDIGKFEAELQRALDLNAHDPEILAEAGHYLCYKGEIERGTEFSKRARALNPLHPGWYHFSPALLNYHQGRYKEMLSDVQRISMPNFFWTHLLNAAALGRMGRDQAGASLALMLKARPGVSAAAEMQKWIVSQENYDNLMLGLRQAGHNE